MVFDWPVILWLYAIHNQYNGQIYLTMFIICSTFSIVDKEGTCFPVMLYNLRSGCGMIVGDTVAIPEPYVQSTDFTGKDKVNHISVLLANIYIPRILWSLHFLNSPFFPEKLAVSVQMFKFLSLRVDSPVVMVVNKRKLGRDKLSPSVLSFEAKSEWCSPTWR